MAERIAPCTPTALAEAGITQMLAPFLLGYDRRDRAATVLHVLGGALVVAISLFTDYRAEKGIGGPLPEPS